MSIIAAEEMAGVLERINAWPVAARPMLALKVLESLDRPDQAMVESPRPAPRGRPVEDLRGLAAGPKPPPDDDDVKRWIDEHRMGKYG